MISKKVVKKKIVSKKSKSLESTYVNKSSILSNTFDINKMCKGGSNRWLVLSLSEETSLEEHYETIEYEVYDIFGPGTEYFIPLYKEKVGHKEVCLVLFDGYLFVQEPKKGFSDVDFNKIRTTHVRAPLINKGANKGAYNYIKNFEINCFKKELKKKIKDMVPKVGQIVIPREGVFKDLEGKVLSISKKDMTLIARFETSSRIVEAPVSIINVDCE